MKSLINIRFAVLLLAVLLCAGSIRNWNQPETLNDDPSYLPSSNYIRTLALGHNESLASIFWIQGIIGLGSSAYSGNEFHWLGTISDITTKLDSLFYNSYYFLGSMTDAQAQDSTTLNVLRRGVQQYPSDWKLAMLLSMHLQSTQQGLAEAAKVMEHFSTDTAAPLYVRHLHRTFLAKSADPLFAAQIYFMDYLNPDMQGFRTILSQRIADQLNIPPAEKENLNLLLRTSLEDKGKRSAEVFAEIIRRWLR